MKLKEEYGTHKIFTSFAMILLLLLGITACGAESETEAESKIEVKTEEVVSDDTENLDENIAEQESEEEKEPELVLPDIVVEEVSIAEGSFSSQLIEPTIINVNKVLRCGEDLQNFPSGCKTVSAKITNNTNLSYNVALGFEVSYEWADKYDEIQTRTGKIGFQSLLYDLEKSPTQHMTLGYAPYIGLAPKEEKLVRINLSNLRPADHWDDFDIKSAKLLDVRYVDFLSEIETEYEFIPVASWDGGTSVIANNEKYTGGNFRIGGKVNNQTSDYWSEATVQYIAELDGFSVKRELVLDHVAPQKDKTIPDDLSALSLDKGIFSNKNLDKPETTVKPVFLYYMRDTDKG